MSPGSLRYYGLGLQNGNYTVTLQFTEIQIADSTSWRSLGRRVFDVYIQAWRLHENDHDIELVDANLLELDEEEVKRVMGVALLCTHTSPQLRPSMSRVVAMLLGDTEVGLVTARPGYLTDLKFDETTTFMTADSQANYSQFSSSSATMGADPCHSPINAAHQEEDSLLVFQGRNSD
ncbi:hypothetical protein RHGRI_017709 [Rhododendron griersonianum]|uniref:non-specific serine/threonine protein kinase n=1 Tax=Rhododendron griersonianum TaxID=479676 RepID=A0AAV6JYS9_9ERIC|nr:hypothetical protein RHGRI_017709 [Rhododendron griersonianum]